MTKKAIAILTVIIILLGIGTYTLLNSNKEKETVTTNSKIKNETEILGVVLIANSLATVWPNNTIDPIERDIVLDNGTTVKTDGTISTAAGEKIVLLQNEFLSTDGNRSIVDVSKYTMRTAEEEAHELTEDGEYHEEFGETEAEEAAEHGAYKDYSAETMASEQKSGQKVVLFFHATWCPFCRAADSAFQQKLRQIPRGVTVLKIDYDANTNLRQKYGVLFQHTFVQINSQGEKVTLWSGGDIENLKKYLK